jgi:hypothetical protein
MDRDALLAAVRGLRADAVINQLTDLNRLPMRHRDLVRTNALRETGTANLLAAAQETGARRFFTQSFFGGYGYGDHGSQLLTEDDPSPGSTWTTPRRARWRRLKRRPGEAFTTLSTTSRSAGTTSWAPLQMPMEYRTRWSCPVRSSGRCPTPGPF